MLKKIVVLLWLTGLLLPFVLLTDLYPFLRLGMFAEPVQHKSQSESFFVVFRDKKQQNYFFNPQNIGFEDSHFQYILRNHVYQNKATFLLQTLHHKTTKLIAKPEIWYLYRAVADLKLQKADTTCIATWQKK